MLAINKVHRLEWVCAHKNKKTGGDSDESKFYGQMRRNLSYSTQKVGCIVIGGMVKICVRILLSEWEHGSTQVP